MNEPLAIDCRQIGSSWECHVSVGDGAGTTHVVRVSSEEIARFAPGHDEPTNLVEQSFQFLLGREPKESILGRFRVSDIERYFPEFPTVILGQLTE